MIAASQLLRDRFGVEPATVVRSPGRVNLIGEHTDYSLLPVLPMAIGRRIEVAATAAGDETVTAVSATEGPELSIATAAPVSAAPGWGKYVRGCLEALGERGLGRGAHLAVTTNLDAGGGLSSSSALTVGVLESLNRVWDLGLGREEIIDLAITAERATGVEGGSMDQTVIVLAAAGHALRIDFADPATRHVPVPPELSFVIGYSGTSAPKTAAVRDHYNGCVVSCRAAAVLLAAATGGDPGDPPALGRVAALVTKDDVASLPETIDAAGAARRAGTDVKAVTALTAGVYPTSVRLRVREAARHVLAEAERVDAAEHALRSGDGAGLGSLFDASHESLTRFGVTTPQLDAVVAAARSAGAFGARLTGAGFGGWAVAASHPGAVPEITAAMIRATGGPALEVKAAEGLT